MSTVKTDEAAPKGFVITLDEAPLVHRKNIDLC